MQVADSLLGFQDAHNRVQFFDLQDFVVIFVSVDGNSQTDRTFGELSITGNSFLQTDKGNSIGKRILFQFLSGDNNTHADFDKTSKCSSGISVTGWRDGWHVERIGCGDIFERHAYRCLAAKFLVQVLNIFLREHFRCYHGQYGTITVQKSTHINGIALCLFWQTSGTTLVGSNISCVLVRLDRSLTLLCFGIDRQSCFSHFGQPIARFVFIFWVLCQGNSDSISQSIGKESSNTDGRFHSAIFTLTCFSNSQVQRIVPSHAVLFRSQQTIRLYHDQWITGLHRKNEVVVILASTDIGEFQGRFYHTTRCVSVER
mmetsp:Transcript_23157/g.64187  ORF Transcript_23157/g.64187 Transcript_23157/m.64187 type:complete len:315 (+) Transcript_23157:1970-2914(+)